jgi:hypothetical protein
MNAKISPNLISFVTVRRGDWILKISVYKTREVLVIAQHWYEQERIVVRHFPNHDLAADFLDNLVKEDTI